MDQLDEPAMCLADLDSIGAHLKSKDIQRLVPRHGAIPRCAASLVHSRPSARSDAVPWGRRFHAIQVGGQDLSRALILEAAM